MVLKNVRASWIFIKTPDESGKYRVTFTVDDETYKELMLAIEECAKANKEELKNLEWKGSYKQLEDGSHQFGAKASSKFENKKGEKVVFDLPVYNVKAQRLKKEEVPYVQNDAILNLAVDPYFIEYKKKKGVMLGLRSVQLIEYKEYEGADSNPFKDESDDNSFESEMGIDASPEEIFS